MQLKNFFKGKHILVIGASSGLGATLANELAHYPVHLTLTGRHQERLERTQSNCQQLQALSVHVHSLSVENKAHWDRLFQSRFAPVDILIYCAGKSQWETFEALENADSFSQEVMETNYIGLVRCTQLFLGDLKKTRGSLVAISSIQGKIPAPFHSAYVASKHALEGFLETLRLEEANNISILIVIPQWIKGTLLRTRSLKKPTGNTHQKHSLTTTEVSRAIMKSIAQRKSRIYLPWYLRILCIAQSIAPDLINAFVKKIVNREHQNNLTS